MEPSNLCLKPTEWLWSRLKFKDPDIECWGEGGASWLRVVKRLVCGRNAQGSGHKDEEEPEEKHPWLCTLGPQSSHLWLGNHNSATTTELWWGFPGGSMVKHLPANAGHTRDSGWIPGSGRLLEEEMATHSSILIWRNPWTGELQSTGLQGVRHDWATKQEHEHSDEDSAGKG